ncbi:deoxynucleoside kinase [bacterium]|nr:deoxynucleoside kinase [bacterium]MBU1073237.1 deoxynucleoside kinase [bacterium]MBU1674147.1 deoxynucleoside kinase [bacterium]
MSGTRDIPFYLSISGNIGVGKSTVCALVGDAFDWPTYYEPVDGNPYLADYYRDMRRWSFHLQIYFLSKRFEVQKKIIEHGRSAVQDRTIYEDVEIFAKVLNKRGAMDDRDYENYREVFRNMVSFLRPPDLILYLRASVDAAMSRIEQRARDCETGIPRDFIQDLNDAYEDWIGRAEEICPVRVIDSEKINLRDDSEAQRELLDYIGVLHERKRRAGSAGGGA